MSKIATASAAAKDFRHWLESIKDSPWNLQFIPEKLENEKVIVLEAVQRNGLVLQCASDEMRNDREIVLAAVVQDDGWALKYASERLKGDREILLAAVKSNGCALYHGSEEMKADRIVVQTAIQNDIKSLAYASYEMRDDKHFILKAVNQGGKVFPYASNRLKSDKEVVFTAVQHDGLMLQYAAKELRNDIDIVHKSVQNNGYALQYASDLLRDNQVIVLAAIEQGGADVLQFTSHTLKKDKQFMMRIIQINGQAIQYVAEEVKLELEIELAKQTIFEFHDEQQLLKASLSHDASTPKMQTLDPMDPEYITVSLLFHKTCPYAQYAVVEVKRIVHPLRQCQQYLLKKAMDNRADGVGSNEQWLFHGTNHMNITDIIFGGFNRSFAKRGLYGMGIYFARDASYSAQYSTCDENNCWYMFLARILLGQSAQGHSWLHTPPRLPERPDKPCDSLVNDTANPSIFVSCHNDNQASPEYLIKFINFN